MRKQTFAKNTNIKRKIECWRKTSIKIKNYPEKVIAKGFFSQQTIKLSEKKKAKQVMLHK